MFLDELGQRIRTQREKLGLKQSDIANALQVSPQAVSKWERGENGPDLTLLPPLARLLGVSVDWLLDAANEGKDTFEATVFVSDVEGAYGKSLGMAPADFAAWINGLLHQMTEAVLRFDGVPVKYMGDALLGFFAGVDHARRALDAARIARDVVSSSLRLGLHSGPVYLGNVGHVDYARPDIMGETVNLSFLIKDWAYQNCPSGVAVSASVLEGAGKERYPHKFLEKVEFKGIGFPVDIHEIGWQ